MKKALLTATLTTYSLWCLAQSDVKTKKATYNDNFQIVYNVSEDGKTKNGLYYLKDILNEDIWTQGYFKDDKPVGTWYFFNSQKGLAKRYNYDKKKLVYINQSEMKDVDVDIAGLDSVTMKQATVPVPLCSVDELVSIISRRIFNIYNGKDTDLEAKLVVHVDTNGNASYEANYKSMNKIIKQKIDINNKNFKIDWIPATYKETPIEADFILYTVLSRQDGYQYKRLRWND